MGPGDQIVELQLQGLVVQLLRQLLQLRSGPIKLCGQRRSKSGVAPQAWLPQQPSGDGFAWGKAWMAQLLLHLLQGAQGMGQQAQVMALACGQEGGVETVDLVWVERIHA